MSYYSKLFTGWIGVDLDGTLAHYNDTTDTIGEPIPLMLARVKRWLVEGHEVRIFTARASSEEQCEMITAWLKENGLPDLDITNRKDYDMKQLWDDRAVQVLHNKGEILAPVSDPHKNLHDQVLSWKADGFTQEQIEQAVNASGTTSPSPRTPRSTPRKKRAKADI